MSLLHMPAVRLAGALLLAGAACGAVQAKAPADKVAELDGPKLTCIGAERAASSDGVAAYTGKFAGTWPGAKPEGWSPGPYADEKPLFTINDSNSAQYADKLTEGQKALLKAYPQAYRINVYPSHRDFKDSDVTCQKTKKNAASAELVHDGKGISGVGGAIPFPIPQSGLEAIWNVVNSGRAWTQSAVCDIADVYANGSIAWGRNKFMVLTPPNEPGKEPSLQDKINAYFYTGYLLPQRDKGFVAVGYQPNDFNADATQSWQYQPGIRRVRQAPEVGFDYPVPPGGLRTVDDDYGFNGSPERYNWKLVGKKTYYVPYNNFKISDQSIKYADLIKPNTINPDYVRYEAHRVWVIEGTLKQGVRHIYGKRIVYADEDTWAALWADNFDMRGQIYRTSLVTYFFSPQSKTWLRTASVYHDLTSKAYEAGYLTNERSPDEFWKVNMPMTPAMFAPEAAGRGTH